METAAHKFYKITISIFSRKNTNHEMRQIYFHRPRFDRILYYLWFVLNLPELIKTFLLFKYVWTNLPSFLHVHISKQLTWKYKVYSCNSYKSIKKFYSTLVFISYRVTGTDVVFEACEVQPLKFGFFSSPLCFRFCRGRQGRIYCASQNQARSRES